MSSTTLPRDSRPRWASRRMASGVTPERLAEAIEACINGKHDAAVEIGDLTFMRASMLVDALAPDVLRSIEARRAAA